MVGSSISLRERDSSVLVMVEGIWAGHDSGQCWLKVEKDERQTGQKQEQMRIRITGQMKTGYSDEQHSKGR